MEPKAIRIVRGTNASGVSLLPGAVYRVGTEVSEADAQLLLRLVKAVPAALTRTEPKAPAPRGGRARP